MTLTDRLRTRAASLLPSGRPPRTLAVALALGAGLCGVLAGCGPGPSAEPEGAPAQLRVTRDFGQRVIATARAGPVPEGQTVMGLLRSELAVRARGGGRSIQVVDGIGARGRRGWFLWVNGVALDRSAADYELRPGAVVQLDYRDWRAARRVPAIVGAFPQPLRGGWGEGRRPVRLECEQADSAACETVAARLGSARVPVSRASLGAPYTESVLRVLVGRWPALRQSVSALERGPRASGVFARFARDGRSLALLDGGGETVRTVDPGDGTGLIAALFPRTDQLAWVVTGLDDAGVEAAAGALRAGRLRDAFAVAVGDAGVEKLPLEGP